MTTTNCCQRMFWLVSGLSLLLLSASANAADTTVVVAGANVASGASKVCSNNTMVACVDDTPCFQQCAGGSDNGSGCQTDDDCGNDPPGCSGLGCDVGRCAGPGVCQPRVCVDITTSQAIVVGGTDMDIVYDPAALEGAGASSTTLSNFAPNPVVPGRIRSGSLSLSGDSLPPGGVLITACFTVGITAGCTTVTVEDGDGNTGPGDPGNDFDGPVGSGQRITYDVTPGQICVTDLCGNGNVGVGEDCDPPTWPGGCCTQDCKFAEQGSDCTDEGNACTDDQCDGQGNCTHLNNTVSCDDGLFCNGIDLCSGGECTHLGDPCAGGSQCNATCDEAADSCYDTLGTPCDADGDVCTDEQCNGRGQCELVGQVPNCLPCVSDTGCPAGSVCEAGACQACNCPDLWDPVCGVDGRTYGSACQARCAHLEVAHPGECPPACEGSLAFVEPYLDGNAEIDGLDGARSVALSPDGRHVYVAGRNDDALVVFERDTVTGRLTFVEAHWDGRGGVDGLNGAYSVVVSPDGAQVYTAGFEDDAVAVFNRDAATGKLTFVEIYKNGVAGVNGLNGVNSILVSPDGFHVYTSAKFDDAVAVFDRDAPTGRLGFIELQRNGVGGVSCLNGASFVAVSADGNHLYATSSTDDSLVAFGRDPGTGKLTFIECYRDGVGGVDGLNGASSAVVSRDGRHVYTTALTDDAVALFTRDITTGRLNFIEQYKNGVGSIEGLNRAASVVVNATGRRVYATGYDDDSLVVFDRDIVTGRLTFIERQRDGVGVVEGLNGASSVAASADGAHVYAAGFTDDAVAAFRVVCPCGDGILGTGEECDDGNNVACDGCSPDCRQEFCGDGIVCPPEECEPGTICQGGGSCANDCTCPFLPSCGNEALEGNEECDDGNNVACDGCSPDCRQEFCGDGTVCPPEQCEPGSNCRNGGSCLSDCTCEGCCFTAALDCMGSIPAEGYVTIDVGPSCPLGAYSLGLSWDPSLLGVDSIEGGAAPEFSGPPTWSVDNGAGSLRCNGFQSQRLDGPTGAVGVVQVNMRRLNPAGQALVTLSVNSVFDTSGFTLGPCQPDGGTATCLVAAGHCGDVNCDAAVDVGDALLVAQYDVGLRGCGEAPFGCPGECDINPQPQPDGTCDIGDALKMAQCDAGIVGCGFGCGSFACGLSLFGRDRGVDAKIPSFLSSRPASVRLVVPSGPQLPGDIVTGEVTVAVGDMPLGAYSLELDCDRSAVEIVSIGGGATPEFSSQPNQVIVGCHANLNAFQSADVDRPTGVVSVAQVVLRVKGKAAPCRTSLIRVRVKSLFGTNGGPIHGIPEDAELTVGSGQGTCVSHFRMYRVTAKKGTPKFAARDVGLDDQFESRDMTVVKPLLLGSPVDKNGEGIIDPAVHLECYVIRDAEGKGQGKQPRFVPRMVEVSNQFGTEVLAIKRPSSLCVPTLVGHDAPPSLETPLHSVDLFKCYNARRPTGAGRFVKHYVSLEDEFGSRQAVVVKPVMLCNPVEKNGEGINDPTTHLVCYNTKDMRTVSSAAEPGPQAVFTRNQFGTEALMVGRSTALCVPSQKTELDAQ